MLLGVYDGYKSKECELSADLIFHPIKTSVKSEKQHEAKVNQQETIHIRRKAPNSLFFNRTSNCSVDHYMI